MDTRTDNKESQMEKAEGSRENVNLPETESVNSGGDAGAPMERGAGQDSHPERPLTNPGGITNRPIEEEEQNQRAIPPRGRNKK